MILERFAMHSNLNRNALLRDECNKCAPTFICLVKRRSTLCSLIRQVFKCSGLIVVKAQVIILDYIINIIVCPSAFFLNFCLQSRSIKTASQQ